MPIYEYRCEKCKAEFEKIVFSSGKDEPVICPRCKSKKTRKLMSAFAGGKSGCSTCAATTCSST
ncbi:MAG TPA: zinc ribbon domain-containing protein [Syntrophales bacterium]|nr:zinc ribbon domain-containing protein [Syntrophales bacterium]HOM06944.1 zinc ribbon domain-containing protein [Syntrophales bacterium]HON98806.1 zinc ribbon domain-containing protein [Syntrophales bacterium]HPC00934.1 zinc ribbon domain-containing protein [Syntrophales bacterium]HPQ06485.1 zinc ribbon domain-containing protein [Syntrophales bacterium]